MKKLFFLSCFIALVSCTTPAEEPIVFDDYYIALVSLSDGEAKPEPSIGCGDAIELVKKEGESNGYNDRVQNALEALFAMKESNYGESGLYNSLYQSDLTVEAISEEGSHFVVHLGGTITSGGVCDDPRIEEQIMETIRANVTPGREMEIQVTIDDKDLHEYFDLSGQ